MKEKIDIYNDIKYRHLYDCVAPRPQPSDFAIHFFNEAEGLTFVDIGANDGVVWSNSLSLEINYGWNGICIEPHPVAYKKLTENRSSKCLNLAVSDVDFELDFLVIEGKGEMLSGLIKDFHPDHKKRINEEVARNVDKAYKQKVNSKPLHLILQENNISRVNYLSIDTEGSELSIIKGIDFSKTNIDLISLEVNYEIEPTNQLMDSVGYKFLNKVCGDAFYAKK
jgi:FkbM family methyltransferase